MALWPKEDLALIWATANQVATSAKPLFEAVTKIDPTIADRYTQRTGRELTPNIVAQRVDKGIRYGEWKSYAHLLDAAEDKVQTHMLV